MTTTVDTTSIDRAELLAALYDRAQPQGLGFMHFDPEPMTRDEAQRWIAQGIDNSSGQAEPECYFDYLRGRVMKIDVLPDLLNPRLYDRDNGAGAVAEVVAGLRAKATA